MKRSTNKYRRCPNCPHHVNNDLKCCCQKNSISTMKSRAMTSRPKKQPSTIDNTSVINSTIPTIIAQFSALRSENNHLKRQLLNVSTFLKDDVNHSVSLNHNQPSLSQKLFLSNKNLKEAMIQIDNLSKMNKQLYERNTKLTQQYEGIKIQLKQMQAYCFKYKKRCKDYSQTIDQIQNKSDVQKIKKQNYYLEQENQSLREEIRGYKFQNNQFHRSQTLSPEWIAHTNNKAYKQQHNIIKQQSGPLDINVQIYKRKIFETISTLKSQSTSFTHTYDHVGNNQTINIQKLIPILLQTYTETIYGYFNILIKELNRKLNNYQKKLNNLINKIQNFLIIFKNKKLKKKIYPNINFLKTQRIPMMDITNYHQ